VRLAFSCWRCSCFRSSRLLEDIRKLNYFLTWAMKISIHWNSSSSFWMSLSNIFTFILVNFATLSNLSKSAAARLLRLWVRIPAGAWMFVCCECNVLSGRGLYDELITRPEESHRLVCDLETS
jgi:hypothetical protein